MLYVMGQQNENNVQQNFPLSMELEGCISC